MSGTAPSKKDRKTRTAPSLGAAVATQTVSEADIARRAYEYYCARGGQGGDALDDWLRAERELTAAPASSPAPVKRQRTTRTRSVN